MADIEQEKIKQVLDLPGEFWRTQFGEDGENKRNAIKFLLTKFTRLEKTLRQYESDLDFWKDRCSQRDYLMLRFMLKDETAVAPVYSSKTPVESDYTTCCDSSSIVSYESKVAVNTGTQGLEKSEPMQSSDAHQVIQHLSGMLRCSEEREKKYQGDMMKLTKEMEKLTLEAEKERLQTQSRSKSIELKAGKFFEENEQLKQVHSDMQAAMEEQAMKHQTVKAELEEKLKKLTAENRELRNQDQADLSTEGTKKLLSENEELKKALEEVETEMAKREDWVEENLSNQAALQQKIEELTAEVEELREICPDEETMREIEGLMKHSEVLTAENERLKQLCENGGGQEEVEAIKTENGKLKDQCNKLLVEACQRNNIFNKQKTELRAESEVWKQRCQKLMEELKKMENEQKQVRNQEDDDDDDNVAEGLLNEIQNLRVENNKLVEEAYQRNSMHNQKVGELRQEMNRFQRSINAGQNPTDEKESLREKQNSERVLEEEYDDLKNQMIFMRKTVKCFYKNQIKIEKENESLQKTLEEERHEFDDHLLLLQAAHQQLTEQGHVVEDLQKTLAKAENRNEEYQTDIDRAERKMEKMTKRYTIRTNNILKRRMKSNRAVGNKVEGFIGQIKEMLLPMLTKKQSSLAKLFSRNRGRVDVDWIQFFDGELNEIRQLISADVEECMGKIIK